MNEYFKMIQRVADTDPTSYNICELTKLIATKAGYRRDVFTYKNGRQTIRTFYDKPFDNVLTAKWLLHYKKLFYSKLHSHPEMSEYYSFIINRTFFITMKSFNMEKIIKDSETVINQYVSMTLANRIGEALYALGSQKRLDGYNRHLTDPNEKVKLKLQTSINHMAYSYEQMIEDVGFNLPYEEKGTSDILVDLRIALADNDMGERLLEAMTGSNGRVSPNKIDNFVKMSPEECNEGNRSKLTKAWNTIVKVVYDYTAGSEDNRKWKTINTVKYSFE